MEGSSDLALALDSSNLNLSAGYGEGDSDSDKEKLTSSKEFQIKTQSVLMKNCFLMAG